MKTERGEQIRKRIEAQHDKALDEAWAEFKEQNPEIAKEWEDEMKRTPRGLEAREHLRAVMLAKYTNQIGPYEERKRAIARDMERRLNTALHGGLQ